MEVTVINDIPDVIDIVSELVENGEFLYLDHIGSGFFGQVFRYGDYALKVFRKEKDGEILAKLQGHPCFPKVYAYSDKFMISEFIEGTRWDKLHIFNVPLIDNWEDIILDAANFVLNNGLFPTDISKENVIIDASGFPHIIDVGYFEHESIYKFRDIHSQIIKLKDSLLRKYITV